MEKHNDIFPVCVGNANMLKDILSKKTLSKFERIYFHSSWKKGILVGIFSTDSFVQFYDVETGTCSFGGKE